MEYHNAVLTCIELRQGQLHSLEYNAVWIILLLHLIADDPPDSFDQLVYIY